jgi:DNA-binding CsgD family transcriptional regulator
MSENSSRSNQPEGEPSDESILAHPVFNLMRWLANNPLGEELARELALNYFRRYGATQVRLSVTDEEGALHFVGVFGADTVVTGDSQDINEWQARTDEIANVEIGPDGLGWSSSGRYLQASLNEFGNRRGWITIGFIEPHGKNQLKVEQLLKILKQVVAMHMVALIRQSPLVLGGRRSPVDRDAFSPRQLSILQGMIQGKTNNELALELGFSVSTVRHETMRIFELLNVSDRREAARDALERGIF